MNDHCQGRGDVHTSRLLFYLNELTDEKFANIVPLKNNVWLCEGEEQQWILKAFSSLRSLQNQVTLTNFLRSSAFNHTYQFHPIHQRVNVFFEGTCYGLIEYISPHYKKSFHYQTKRNRTAALLLLTNYHQTVRHFFDKIKNQLSSFHQLDKWQQRLSMFKQNLPMITAYFPSYYLFTYIDWAEWSLEKMQQMKDDLVKEKQSVIHGDLADHNFLLGADQRLYLIDFDLIRIAPEMIDMLQIANRMLPFLNWSLQELWTYKAFQRYEQSSLFLIALAFPTDIFREWNRFVKSSKKKQQLIWNYLSNLTFQQFAQRKQFFKTISKSL